MMGSNSIRLATVKSACWANSRGPVVVGQQDRDRAGRAGAEQIEQIVADEQRLGRLDRKPPAQVQHAEGVRFHRAHPPVPRRHRSAGRACGRPPRHCLCGCGSECRWECRAVRRAASVSRAPGVQLGFGHRLLLMEVQDHLRLLPLLGASSSPSPPEWVRRSCPAPSLPGSRRSPSTAALWFHPSRISLLLSAYTGCLFRRSTPSRRKRPQVLPASVYTLWDWAGFVKPRSHRGCMIVLVRASGLHARRQSLGATSSPILPVFSRDR